MAGGRPLFALLALIFIAGGIVLELFIILSGVVYSTPFNKAWFLEASTGGIGSSPTVASWTYWTICNDVGGKYTTCGNVHPAFPFNPPEAQNFGTSTGVPAAFVGTHFYYYMSRFAWVFYLIALFFAVISLFVGLLALCSRIGSFLASGAVFAAFFFQALASALMTAWTVKARNVWRAASIDSSLGRYAYGFSWAAFACYFLAVIFFCLGGSTGRKEKKQAKAAAREDGTREKRGFFGRNASTKSRETGVKDDYS